MDLFILDGYYRRTEVIDSYESLIWTERFSAFGEFQLDIHATNESRTLLTEGTWLAIRESYRTMVIETIEDMANEDGTQMLRVKGRSLEVFLDDRMAVSIGPGSVMNPKWVITDTAPEIIRTMVESIMVMGAVHDFDILPMLQMGSSGLFPPDTVPYSNTVLTAEIEPKSLYTAVKERSDLYDIGFRMVREPDEPNLYFDVYTGCDRTTGQTTLQPVIFSPDLDNLQNTTEFKSLASYKNVAFVISGKGFTTYVQAENDSEQHTGLNRRLLVVNASDIDAEDEATALPLMIQKGREELSKNRRFSAFDGELSQNSQYKYGVHYNLGDLVEMRNVTGTTNKMRVSEQIFICDGEGERSYPTLSINQFIQPGTWLAWDYNQVWADLENDAMTWADQP